MCKIKHHKLTEDVEIITDEKRFNSLRSNGIKRGEITLGDLATIPSGKDSAVYFLWD